MKVTTLIPRTTHTLDINPIIDICARSQGSLKAQSILPQLSSLEQYRNALKLSLKRVFISGPTKSDIVAAERYRLLLCLLFRSFSFPIPGLKFIWHDAFSDQRVSHDSVRQEIAETHYALAVITSGLGDFARATGQLLVAAAILAGENPCAPSFDRISFNHYPQQGTEEFQPQSLVFLARVMHKLAGAEERTLIPDDPTNQRLTSWLRMATMSEGARPRNNGNEPDIVMPPTIENLLKAFTGSTDLTRAAFSQLLPDPYSKLAARLAIDMKQEIRARVSLVNKAVRQLNATIRSLASGTIFPMCVMRFLGNPQSPQPKCQVPLTQIRSRLSSLVSQWRYLLKSQSMTRMADELVRLGYNTASPTARSTSIMFRYKEKLASQLRELDADLEFSTTVSGMSLWDALISMQVEEVPDDVLSALYELLVVSPDIDCTLALLRYVKELPSHSIMVPILTSQLINATEAQIISLMRRLAARRVNALNYAGLAADMLNSYGYVPRVAEACCQLLLRADNPATYSSLSVLSDLAIVANQRGISTSLVLELVAKLPTDVLQIPDVIKLCVMPLLELVSRVICSLADLAPCSIHFIRAVARSLRTEGCGFPVHSKNCAEIIAEIIATILRIHRDSMEDALNVSIEVAEVTYVCPQGHEHRPFVEILRSRVASVVRAIATVSSGESRRQANRLLTLITHCTVHSPRRLSSGGNSDSVEPLTATSVPSLQAERAAASPLSPDFSSSELTSSTTSISSTLSDSELPSSVRQSQSPTLEEAVNPADVQTLTSESRVEQIAEEGEESQASAIASSFEAPVTQNVMVSSDNRFCVDDVASAVSAEESVGNTPRAQELQETSPCAVDETCDTPASSACASEPQTADDQSATAHVQSSATEQPAITFNERDIHPPIETPYMDERQPSDAQLYDMVSPVISWSDRHSDVDDESRNQSDGGVLSAAVEHMDTLPPDLALAAQTKCITPHCSTPELGIEQISSSDGATPVETRCVSLSDGTADSASGSCQCPDVVVQVDQDDEYGSGELAQILRGEGIPDLTRGVVTGPILTTPRSDRPMTTHNCDEQQSLSHKWDMNGGDLVQDPPDYLSDRIHHSDHQDPELDNEIIAHISDDGAITSAVKLESVISVGDAAIAGMVEADPTPTLTADDHSDQSDAEPTRDLVHSSPSPAPSSPLATVPLSSAVKCTSPVSLAPASANSSPTSNGDYTYTSSYFYSTSEAPERPPPLASRSPTPCDAPGQGSLSDMPRLIPRGRSSIRAPATRDTDSQLYTVEYPLDPEQRKISRAEMAIDNLKQLLEAYSNGELVDEIDLAEKLSALLDLSPTQLCSSIGGVVPMALVADLVPVSPVVALFVVLLYNEYGQSRAIDYLASRGAIRSLTSAAMMGSSTALYSLMTFLESPVGRSYLSRGDVLVDLIQICGRVSQDQECPYHIALRITSEGMQQPLIYGDGPAQTILRVLIDSEAASAEAVQVAMSRIRATESPECSTRCLAESIALASTLYRQHHGIPCTAVRTRLEMSQPFRRLIVLSDATTRISDVLQNAPMDNNIGELLVAEVAMRVLPDPRLAIVITNVAVPCFLAHHEMPQLTLPVLSALSTGAPAPLVLYTKLLTSVLGPNPDSWWHTYTKDNGLQYRPAISVFRRYLDATTAPSETICSLIDQFAVSLLQTYEDNMTVVELAAGLLAQLIAKGAPKLSVSFMRFGVTQTVTRLVAKLSNSGHPPDNLLKVHYFVSRTNV